MLKFPFFKRSASPLTDPTLNDQLREDGYVVLSLSKGFSTGKYFDRFSNCKRVNELILENPHLNTGLTKLVDNSSGNFSKYVLPLLNRYECINEAVLIREPGPNGFIRVGQERPLVDETLHVGLTAFLPLQTSFPGNGQIQIVKGSHLKFNDLRDGESPNGKSYESIRDYIETQFLTPINLEPGQLLLVDHRALYAIGPNMSHDTHMIVVATLIPKGKRNKQDSATEPSPKDQMTVFEFDERYGNNFRSKRGVFKDTELEEEVFDKGFAIKPVFSKEQIDKCKKLYESTRDIESRYRYNTLEVNQYEYRKAISEEVKTILGDTILALFKNYKFVGVNFAVKKSDGAPPFDSHIDDIHVNEAEYNSINIWIPLVDVDENNGALYIVPNSHKLPQPTRGIGLPFAYADKEALIQKYKFSVNINTGEALLFHTKIIHGSPSNFSNSDRPALIIGLIPSEASPILFMRYPSIGHNHVEKFEAPEDLFFRLQIDNRPEGFQSLGIYDYTPVKVSDHQFIETISP